MKRCANEFIKRDGSVEPNAEPRRLSVARPVSFEPAEIEVAMQAVLDVNSQYRLIRGELPGSWIVQEVCSDALAGGQAVQRYFTRSMPLQAAGVLTWLKASSLPTDALARLESLL